GVRSRPVGETSRRLDACSPLARACPCRGSGGETADGMSCPPIWREHSFIRSPVVLPQAHRARMSTMEWSRRLLFFLGNDWAEEHHDVELQNESGKVLARAKLPEGIAGITKLHAMIGVYMGDEDEAEVIVGIE